MKTHFIFNISLLANSEITLLIRDLLKNNFPVSVIANQQGKSLGRSNLRLKKVTFINSGQGKTLRELYLAACPQAAELRYLTVVFADTRESIQAENN